MHSIIIVIIPAFNEEKSISAVIRDIDRKLVSEVIVVNNGSTDDTESEARRAGATVLLEPIPGYGRACLKGIEYATSLKPQPDLIVFLDGDYSDYPEEMIQLVQPILDNHADFVIGSRTLGNREPGSMTFPQRFGNWLATRLVSILYGVRFTDLGPFRAIRFKSLIKLDMQDKTFGWTVEMQLKAAKHRLLCLEIPVRYRKRIGHSKISGTIKGTIMAGYKIITTIFKYA